MVKVSPYLLTGIVMALCLSIALNSSRNFKTNVAMRRASEISISYQQKLGPHNYYLSKKYAIAAMYTKMGSILERKGALAQALDKCQQAIDLNPRNKMAYNICGIIHKDLRHYDAALVHLNKAIALDPKFHHAYNNRGLVYMEQNRHELALKDFHKTIFLAPKEEAVYNNRGIVYVKTSQYDLALADFDKAIELAPRAGNIYANRSRLFDKIGRLAQAHEDALRAESLGFKMEK